MSPKTPKRGEIWGLNWSSDRYLVVSTNEHNLSVPLYAFLGVSVDLDEGLPKIQGDVEVLLSGQPFLVRSWSIQPVYEEELGNLDEDLEPLSDYSFNEVQEAMRNILSVSGTPSRTKPQLVPAQGGLRFADLGLDKARPVVVISSDEFGNSSGHSWIVACQGTSQDRTEKHILYPRKGITRIAMASVIAVARFQLLDRPPPNPAKLDDSDLQEVLHTVRSILGLE